MFAVLIPSHQALPEFLPWRVEVVEVNGNPKSTSVSTLLVALGSAPEAILEHNTLAESEQSQSKLRETLLKTIMGNTVIVVDPQVGHPLIRAKVVFPEPGCKF